MNSDVYYAIIGVVTGSVMSVLLLIVIILLVKYLLEGDKEAVTKIKTKDNQQEKHKYRPIINDDAAYMKSHEWTDKQ